MKGTRAAGLALAALVLAPASRAQNWHQSATVTYDDLGSWESFGWSTSLSGDTLAVGATRQGSWTGRVVVYGRHAGGPNTWGEVQELWPNQPVGGGAHYGYSVAVDGDTLVASTCCAGTSFVFVDGPGGWAELQSLNAVRTVSLSGDTLLATGGGGVLVLDRGGTGRFTQTQVLLPSAAQVADEFGDSHSVTGDTAVVGVPLDDLGEATNRIHGLARDPLTNRVFGSDSVDDVLFLIDPATGRGLPIGSLGPGKIEGLAYDPDSASLFGVDTESDQLVTIDPLTAAVAPVGAVGFERIRGLAFDPSSGQLYGSESTTDVLVRIEPGTGAGTAVGPLGFAGVRGLAFDATSGTLFGTDANTNALIAIDQTTGAASSVGPLGVGGNVDGLGGGSGVLYGALTATDEFLHIDPTLGSGLVVGPIFTTNAGGALVYERDSGGPDAWGQVASLRAPAPAANDQFGAAVAIEGDTVVVGAPGVDASGPADGAAFVYERNHGGPGAFGLTAVLTASSGATLDQFGATVAVDGDTLVVGTVRANAVYVYQRTAPGTWSEVQQLTECAARAETFGASLALDGDTLAVGSTYVSGVNTGAVYLFESSAIPFPATYCSAGTSASGCRATLSACGLASATAPSGLCLQATGVAGQKSGLFFYGANGRQAAPWGNGTSYQCVAPPVNRGGLLSAAGTAGACDGSFAQDLNARWCPTCPRPAHNPGAGAVVQAQLWYRDPLSTSNRSTSLSDAIELTLAP